jgi:limonene-1,2-epoxide hydrolase
MPKTKEQNIQIIIAFYKAFQAKDADTMVAFYHDEVVFEDPAFGLLKGEHAKNMWRMLCQNAEDLEVSASQIDANTQNGKCVWTANYTFRQTNRKVKNIIKANFEFKDGKIYRHADEFDLHKWATQALGFKGWLIGRTRYFQNKLQQQTNRLLSKFEANND